MIHKGDYARLKQELKEMSKAYNSAIGELTKLRNKFTLTEEDEHNLFDLLIMISWMDYKLFKLNKMDKWFDKFYARLENKVVPELQDIAPAFARGGKR